LWFSFADLLESARRLDHKSRTDLWCGFLFRKKGNQMKYSVLLAALLAVSMTACGQKEEAAAPAEAPAAEAPAAEAPAMEAPAAEAPAMEAPAAEAPAAEAPADAAAPAPAQ
jgi:predicted small lipoprotein YifL